MNLSLWFTNKDDYFHANSIRLFQIGQV